MPDPAEKPNNIEVENSPKPETPKLKESSLVHPLRQIGMSDYRYEIASHYAKQTYADIERHKNINKDMLKLSKITQGLFGKDVYELSPQELAIFKVEDPSATTFVNVISNQRFGKAYDRLSPQRKMALMKDILYDHDETLTRDFLSAFIYLKPFDELEENEKVSVEKRVRRLASISQLNGVFIKRQDVQMKPTGVGQIRDEMVSSGERLHGGVYEKGDAMAFMIFGVPMAELSFKERDFIKDRLVEDLESELGVFLKVKTDKENTSIDENGQGKAKRFEETPLELIIGRINEIRKDFYDLENFPQPEYPKGRNILLDPKRPIKDIEVPSSKGFTIREQTHPIGLTVYLKGGNKDIARKIMKLINSGFSQEEALTIIDEELANSSFPSKAESAFVIEQVISKGEQEVEVKWANVGDNIVLIIHNGEIAYDNVNDPAAREKFGLKDYPAYISSFSGAFPLGSKIVILPKFAFSKMDQANLIELVANSKDGLVDIGQMDRITNGQRSGKLRDEGFSNLQTITVGYASDGTKLESVPEKTQFSEDELDLIRAGLETTFKEKFGSLDKSTKISIESAHVYAHESFGLQHAMSSQIGGEAINQLQALGFNPSSELFIDNENAPTNFIQPRDTSLKHDPHQLNGPGVEYIYKSAQLGFRADSIVWEADMNEGAFRIIDQLSNAGKVVQEGKNWYLGEVGGVKLSYLEKRKNPQTGQEEEGIKYTCQLLDAARVVEDLSKFDYSISVLPEFYGVQQEQMKAIIENAGFDPNRIVSIFFNSDGLISANLTHETLV